MVTGRFEARAPMNNVRYALQWVIDAAVETTPKNGVWVEVGVGTGRGISYMARALIDSGRDDVALYAVDPFAGTARCGEQSRVLEHPGRHGDWALFLDMMQRHAPEELRRIHVLRLTSAQASNALDAPLGLVIIDAAHDYESVAFDLDVWAPLAQIIGGDDMVAGSDVEKAVLGRWPDVERRGDPHSAGEQATWPTFRKVLR